MTKRNDLTWRHHYLPQFYLRAWRDSGGQLWTYQEPHPGKATWKRRSTRAVGFEEHLYTVSDFLFHDDKFDVVETEFFQKLDDDAAPVYRKLLDNDLELSEEQRRVWARFVHALYERSPRVIHAQRDPAQRLVNDVCSDILQRASPDGRSRMTLLSHQLSDELFAQRLIIETMIKVIREPSTANALCGLRWALCRTEGNFRLLTGDNAVVLNCGVDRPPAQVFTLALSPTCLFSMSPASWEFSLDVASHLMLLHNAIVFDKSKLLISDRQLSAAHIEALRTRARTQYEKIRGFDIEQPGVE